MLMKKTNKHNIIICEILKRDNIEGTWQWWEEEMPYQVWKHVSHNEGKNRGKLNLALKACPFSVSHSIAASFFENFGDMISHH